MHLSFTVYLSLTPRFPNIIKLYMVASQKEEEEEEEEEKRAICMGKIKIEGK